MFLANNGLTTLVSKYPMCLVQASCVLSYTGSGDTSTADVVVNLAIEDFPTADITVGGTTFTTSDRLSRVSLQFVIRSKRLVKLN